MAVADIDNLELGPCEVWYGTAGAETNSGYSQGGVVARVPIETADLKADQKGTAAQDQVHTGMGPGEVEFPFAEYDYAKMAELIPGATHTTDAATPTKQKIVIVPPIGTKLRSVAKSLILKKIVAGVVSANKDNWLTFPMAAPTTELEYNFDASTQRVLNVKFRCFPNDAGALYWFGDPTAA